MDTYKTIIGLDPGNSGGFTIIQDKNIQIFDMPIKKEGKGKSEKTVYNKQEIVRLLKPYFGPTTIACIESVFSMTGQGVSSSFAFGKGLGILEGICSALEFDIEMVRPQKWKKRWEDRLIMPHLDKPEILKITEDVLKKLPKNKQTEYDETKKEYARKKAKIKAEAKDASRQLAGELYPNLAEMFKLKKNDGRAESLLIAENKRLELLNAK